MGTNELDHLRKEAEKAIEMAETDVDTHGQDAGPLASARATLYLAEVIRSGLAHLAEQLAGRR